MTDQTIFDNWPDAVKHDRKDRKKLTRQEYADLTGLTSGIIQGAEGGRRMKASTIEKLLPVMGDLLPESLGGTAGDGTDDRGHTIIDQPVSPVDRIESLNDLEQVRSWLSGRFNRIMERLGSKPAPPIGMPGNGTDPPSVCQPSEFQAWADWLDAVDAHLGPDTETQVVWWVPTDPYDEDDERDDELVVFTLPEGWASTELSGSTITTENSGAVSVQQFPPVIEGGAYSDLEAQLQESVERARNGPAVENAMAVSSVPDGQREDMEPPVRAERLKVGEVVQGPWQALDPPQPGRAEPDKLVLEQGLDYFTNSAMQTFQDCRRRWWLEYYKKLSSGPRSVTGAAALGTRVHQALAVIYVPEGEDAGDPFGELAWTVADDRRYLESINAPAPKFKELEAEHDFASIIIEGYLEWLQDTGADRDFQVISSERGLVVNPGFPGLENVRLLSKEDTRLLRSIDNAVLFIDHKMVQSFEQLASWAHMNRQMIHYGLVEFLLLAEKQHATIGTIDEREIRRTDGAILNMLRKVKRTATAKPPFYHRHQIRYNMETFRSYWRQVFGTIREMIEVSAKLDSGAEHHEVCPPRPTQDCSWKCQFFTQCSMFDDGSDIDRMMQEVFVTVDPLKRYDTEVARFVE